jgi:pectate lyase
MKKKNLLMMILVIASNLLLQATPPAFPTAEGYGKMATGGRGGKVIEVTNTLDDATGATEGSFRWALNQYKTEPATIVFRVSGIINLVADLRSTRTAGTTIAGQTAPGDGICIRGHKVNLGGSQNMVIRHLRFRIGLQGDTAFVAGGSIGVENSSNWIIDHCTFGWSGEENMTIYDNTLTTVQWCILHEGLYACGHAKGARSYACQWGGQTATYHHNLLAHNANRTPRFNGARSNDLSVLIDYVNNVNYNWGKSNSAYGGDMETGNVHHCNMVNNYYKPGPARPGTSSSYFVQSSFSNAQSTSQIAVWYMNGNFMEGTANADKNTDNTVGLDASAYVAKGVAKTALISSAPFAVPYAVTTETATDAYNSVLAKAGAFPRDTVDRRVVYEVKTGTASGKGTTEKTSDGVTNSYYGVAKGIIDNPVLAFGAVAYPTYNIYNTVTDNDHDGMDDAWEVKYKLDPTNPEDRNTYTQSGYTYLEIYLNSLVGETIDTAAVVMQDQTITITPVATKVYGDAPFTLSSSVSPSGNSVVYSVVSGPATISGNKVTLTGAGKVVILASQSGDVFYNAASATVSFTVNKAPSVITWNNPQSIVWGTALTTTQLNATVSGTSAALVYSPAAGTILPAGERVLTVSCDSDANYEGASKTVSFTVNKAPSVITWNNPQSIVWGTALTTTQLNATVSGTSAALVYSPAAGTILPVGEHVLIVSCDSDANCEGDTATVSFTVNKAPSVITWDNPASIVEGTGLSATQLNATVVGTTASAVYDPTLGTILPAGTHDLTVTFDSDANYEGATKTVALEVTQRTSIENSEVAGSALYPNPARDVVYLRSATKATITFYGILGDVKLIIEALPDQAVDLNALPNGLYVVKITTSSTLQLVKLRKE